MATVRAKAPVTTPISTADKIRTRKDHCLHNLPNSGSAGHQDINWLRMFVKTITLTSNQSAVLWLSNNGN